MNIVYHENTGMNVKKVEGYKKAEKPAIRHTNSWLCFVNRFLFLYWHDPKYQFFGLPPE